MEDILKQAFAQRHRGTVLCMEREVLQRMQWKVISNDGLHKSNCDTTIRATVNNRHGDGHGHDH